MKILYGIQGTGNGHISRARMLAQHFKTTNAEVDYLFTGRDQDKFFDMEIFGDYQYRHGLTFYSKDGSVSYPKTLTQNNPLRFIRDVMSLKVKNYDCIITDFEPVCAWAGKIQRVPVIGIGHQYAFNYQVPSAGEDPIAKIVMKNFAPASTSLGLHWHHFNHTILPPIIDTAMTRQPNKGIKKVLVYLPFENQGRVQQILSQIPKHHFVIYAPQSKNEEYGQLSLRKTCLAGFKADLESADAVICNAGFELISECLHLGLPILAKPQHGQMEQLSNAAALESLDYANTCHKLNTHIIQSWLDSETKRPKITFPDVAHHVVHWLVNGQKEKPETLCKNLWGQVSTI